MERFVIVGLLGVGVGFVASEPPERSPGEADFTSPLSAEDVPSPAMNRALQTWIDVDFDNVPLREFAARLSAQVGVNIAIDVVGIEKAGGKRDQSVTARLQRVRLLSALEVALRPFNLAVDVRPDYLMIVDQKDVAKVNVQHAYPTADLMIDGTGRWLDPNGVSHVQLIQDLVDRDIWETNGGDATIQFHAPSISLAVNAPRETQRRVAAFLDLLRRTREQTIHLLRQRELAKLEQVLLDLDRYNNEQMRLDEQNQQQQQQNQAPLPPRKSNESPPRL
jgi:hypothetical protein